MGQEPDCEIVTNINSESQSHQSHTLSKFAKLAKPADEVADAPNGSLVSLLGSKGSLLNVSDELEWVGGAGAARRGVLLECFGGAGLGGGALFFFGGKAGVGLSDLFGGLTA